MGKPRQIREQGMHSVPAKDVDGSCRPAASAASAEQELEEELDEERYADLDYDQEATIDAILVSSPAAAAGMLPCLLEACIVCHTHGQRASRPTVMLPLCMAQCACRCCGTATR